MNAHDFLLALTIVLSVAAATTVLFQRLRQPVVLGYILAGFIVGPNVPIPLLVDRQIIETLSEFGVILLMFSLGLEFSLSKLIALGPTAGFTAVLQSSLMLWLGFAVGQLFGWTTLESVFTGAIIAISSTTIIAKAFDEQGVRGPTRELVVGVLIVEDLIAILLMAILTAVATGSGLSLNEMARTTGALAAFLVGLVSIGLLAVPRAVRAVLRLGRPETTLVATIGFCFAVSLLADAFGYSVALGAFIAGSLVAESGEQATIEHLVQPVRDMFAAVFFVSVGMLIDPTLIVQYWPAVLVLTLVVVLGKVVGVALGAFLTGNSVRTSVQAGMSLAQIGEFSFIIAGLGLSLRATGQFLYSVAVAVSAVTTLTTPWLIRSAGPVANLVDRKMPGPLQTFVALYGTWLEQLRSRQREQIPSAVIRHLALLIVLDVALLGALVIGTSWALGPMSAFVERTVSVDPAVARVVIVMAAMLLALPLLAGVVRVARRLGYTIAETALPAVAQGSLDLAAAPRRALVVTLQITIVLLTGLPLLAITQPVLGGVYGAVAFGLLLVALGVAFWRGATNLQGHVRAGAQAIVEMLMAQARRGGTPVAVPAETEVDVDPLAEVRRLLPGLGDPTPVRLDPRSPAVGKSLGELNLRGVTGAVVLAIMRGEHGLLGPPATEVLQAGDVLALAGTHEAIDAARRLFLPAEPDASVV
ncbi:MAG TPA: cation:proton antiporter [Candidatus Limnocylindria bacterium]|nr:cation:proton antiporter [Candidatus Limnocylindria bacterium]